MRTAPLIAIEVAAFLLIILESYAFFTYIVPVGTLPHDLLRYTAEAALKVALTFGLGLLWLVVILALTRLYVRSSPRAPSPNPSS
ncbi:MAG TPA: hypothetical protein VEC02_05760 [Nitrososphaerales archaeon]|nr:hypothetical protein [Nitrososphaerales archaeon]